MGNELLYPLLSLLYIIKFLQKGTVENMLTEIHAGFSQARSLRS